MHCIFGNLNFTARTSTIPTTSTHFYSLLLTSTHLYSCQVREELRKLRQLWDQLSVPKTAGVRRPITAARQSTSGPMAELLSAEYALAQRLTNVISEDIRNSNERSLAANETPDKWLAMFEAGPERADLFLRAASEITQELARLQGIYTSLLSSSSLCSSLLLFPPSCGRLRFLRF